MGSAFTSIGNYCTSIGSICSGSPDPVPIPNIDPNPSELSPSNSNTEKQVAVFTDQKTVEIVYPVEIINLDSNVCHIKVTSEKSQTTAMTISDAQSLQASIAAGGAGFTLSGSGTKSSNMARTYNKQYSAFIKEGFVQVSGGSPMKFSVQRVTSFITLSDKNGVFTYNNWATDDKKFIYTDGKLVSVTILQFEKFSAVNKIDIVERLKLFSQKSKKEIDEKEEQIIETPKAVNVEKKKDLDTDDEKAVMDFLTGNKNLDLLWKAFDRNHNGYLDDNELIEIIYAALCIFSREREPNKPKLSKENAAIFIKNIVRHLKPNLENKAGFTSRVEFEVVGKFINEEYKKIHESIQHQVKEERENYFCFRDTSHFGDDIFWGKFKLSEAKKYADNLVKCCAFTWKESTVGGTAWFHSTMLEIDVKAKNQKKMSLYVKKSYYYNTFGKNKE